MLFVRSLEARVAWGKSGPAALGRRGPQRSGLRGGPQRAFAEVTRQRGGVRGAIGERHIGVGAQQVERVALETRGGMRRAPRKGLQRQSMLRTCLPQPCGAVAINVRLPVDRGERGVIVVRSAPDPGQAVAAMHLSRDTRAER